MSTPFLFLSTLSSPSFLRTLGLKNIEGKRLKALFFILLWVFSASSIMAEEKVNINTASHEKLQEIIWVGPVTARKIIDARPFYSLDEIVKVSGIGDKKLKDIKKQGLAWAGPVFEAETEAPSSAINKKEQVAESAIPQEFSSKEGSPLIIDINAASPQELQEIIGIGAVLAQRITEVRPFYSLDELLRVNGIGQVILENIKAQGLAWVNPDFISQKTAKTDIPKESFTDMSARYTQDKKHLKSLPILSIAFSLSFFSAIAVLFLKKSLKTIS